MSPDASHPCPWTYKQEEGWPKAGVVWSNDFEMQDSSDLRFPSCNMTPWLCVLNELAGY